MNPKQLSSRLTLRPFRESDVDDVWSYATNQELTRYTPWKKFKSKEELSSYIQSYCIPHPYCRSVCIDDRSIGLVTVCPGVRGDERRRADLGGVGSPEYWSKGIGQRVVEMVVVEALKVFPEMVRLQAATDVENKGAQKVLERVGFKKDGVLKKYMFHRGEDRDVAMYSLLISHRPPALVDKWPVMRSSL
ncbi:Uncharacterized N-acetyltransferase YoaA [Linum perenne]